MTGKTISERPDLDIDGIKRRLAPAECGTLCNDPACPYTHPVPRNTNDLLEDARALLSAYEQQAGEIERLQLESGTAKNVLDRIIGCCRVGKSLTEIEEIARAALTGDTK
jgi:hypothetical protein